MHRPSLTAAAIVAAALLACATNPATGKKQLMLVSEAQEIAMGKAADQEAIAAYGLYPDPKDQAYVDRLGKSLAAQSERPDLPWSFKVVDDPTVNAFALPGGYIYVTRGIMAHLRSEAELVAVLGHEIGHVTGRHSASQMSKQQLAMGGLMMPAGKDFALGANFGFYEDKQAIAAQAAIRLDDTLTLNAGIGLGLDSNTVGGRVGFVAAW